MKHVLLALLILTVPAFAAPSPHPRLFASADDFAHLRDLVKTNELARLGAERVLFEADQMRRFQVPMHTLEGRRLLAVSQRTLARTLALSMAFRLTGNGRYASRAIEEAETVCSFKDWNPSHFLDTAEMTLAVAIVYDWLYDELSPRKRELLRKGILAKGLCDRDGKLRTGNWVKASNNWGQVCHAGMLAGAIAVMDEASDVAAEVVQRAKTELPRAMAAFAPQGGFPEGPGFYWGYAMSFNVLAIDLLERVYETDFGLAALPGFRESVDYLDCMTGPGGLVFNYGDAGIVGDQQRVARRDTQACIWWLARRFGRPDILSRELPLYRAHCADRTPLNPTPRRSFQRLFPLTLLWLQTPSADVKETKAPLCRLFEGTVPVSVQRSGWNSSAWFVGLKGGSPSAPHGHMDAGSFVLDAKGCRWAVDLGSEDYFRMESAGRNLWGQTQNADRWRIFRLGVESHNTLMINEAMQYAAGAARFLSFDSNGVSKAVLELTPLYPGASRVVRTGTLLPGGGYILDDEVSGVVKDTVVKWQMITPAKIRKKEANVLVLEQNDPDGEAQTLTLTISDPKAVWLEKSVEGRAGPDESRNPGMTQVYFSVRANEDGKAGFAVRFE